MRSWGVRAGLVLAGLAVTQPAVAQVSFLKCKGMTADPRSGKMRRDQRYWVIEEGKLYFWAPVVGRFRLCSFAAPEAICTEQVTEAAIVREERDGNYWSRLWIDRKTGVYSDAGSWGASSGFCRPIPDPDPRRKI